MEVALELKREGLWGVWVCRLIADSSRNGTRYAPNETNTAMTWMNVMLRSQGWCVKTVVSSK